MILSIGRRLKIRKRRLTTGDLIMGTILLAMLALLIALVSVNFKSLLAFANGQSNFKDGLGFFKVSGPDRLLILGLLVATIGAPVWLQTKLTNTSAQIDVAEQQAVKSKVYLDSLEARAHGAIDAGIEAAADRVEELWYRLVGAQDRIKDRDKEQRLAQKIESLEANLDSVARVSIGSRYKAVIGTQKARIGVVAVDTRRAHIFDTETGREEMVLVVHIFDDVAYWDYKQANVFVGDDDETDVNLWRILRSDSALQKFAEFDLVAGLGLESRSGEVSDGLSGRRAESLCTNIDVMLPKDGKTRAVGLDIGVYKGAAQERHESRDPRLRPVILVGIKAREEANYDMFVAELLSKVHVKGLDLGMFENLMPDNSPKWYRSPDCHAQYAFMEMDETDGHDG